MKPGPRWLAGFAFALVAGCGPSDVDGDGWPVGFDCDDGDPSVHPAAAELCNGTDDDCDGAIDAGADDAVPWFADADGDGDGDPRSFALACGPLGTFVADNARDCDDADPTRSTSSDEACNGLDDDCDGRVDEDVDGAVTRYLDADGDGHGDPTATTRACVAPADAVALSDDCDDANAAIHPGATEACDGVDEDCDGRVDDDASDAVDWHPDTDGDGFGASAQEVASCDGPAGWIRDGADCDDFNPANHPGADERCDHLDNNCDALVDGADAVDPVTWYRDLDGDGYGSLSTVAACDPPMGYVGLPGDCLDSDDHAFPGAAEVCGNGVDEDCDGEVDDCGGGGATVTSVADAAVATVTGAVVDDVERVELAGDLDGDGLQDLALTSESAGGSAGIAFLAYSDPGPTGDRSVTTLASLTGTGPGAGLGGFAATSAGDLDGDGFDDLLAGSPGTDVGSASDLGLVALSYGGPVRRTGASALTSADATFSGPQSGSRLGQGLAAVGDLDGDGFDDAAFARSSTGLGEGAVYLLFGDPVRLAGPGAVATLPVIDGDALEGLGNVRGVAGADLDGDGLNDLVMGGYAVNARHLRVLYGDGVRPTVVDAATLPSVVAPATAAVFGTLVRPAGDLDGDGYADLAAADAEAAGLGGPSSGVVWLVAGGASRWVGETAVEDVELATILGLGLGDLCGWGMAALGDGNGDGVDDLAVSALDWDLPFAGAGAVGVFRGPLSGELPFDAAAERFEGISGGAALGSGLAAGDVDGDGLSDLAIASPNTAGGQGRVYILLGG